MICSLRKKVSLGIKVASDGKSNKTRLIVRARLTLTSTGGILVFERLGEIFRPTGGTLFFVPRISKPKNFVTFFRSKSNAALTFC